MNIEFLITCRAGNKTNMNQILTESLIDVLENTSNYSDKDTVDNMIQFSHERHRNGFTLIGFAIKLPEKLSNAESIIDNFVNTIRDKDPKSHVVKFEDPLLRARLAKWADEIFALEMKLRRVLSVIYLNAYQGEEPFSLLRDEKVKLMEQPDQAQMEKAIENQFFHLTFSQYLNLNQRPRPQLPDILEIIESAEQYDDFRAKICRIPVEDEDDVDLITNLKELMGPIENMRNCVAHNRRPTNGIINNYRSALPRLDERLDQYLANFEL